MAKRKIAPPPEPKAPSDKELFARAVIEKYEENINEQMGLLHNRMSAFISEAHIPLPNVIMVLQMLIQEAVDQAFQQYFGEKQ